MHWRRRELGAVINSSSFAVMRFKRGGCKVGFAQRKVSGGITRAYLCRSRKCSGRVG